MPPPPPLRIGALPPDDQEIVQALVASIAPTVDAKTLPPLIRDGASGSALGAIGATSVTYADVPMPPERPGAIKRVASKIATGAAAITAPALRSTLITGTASVPAKIKIARAPVIAGSFKKDLTQPQVGSFGGKMVRPLGASFLKTSD